MRPTRSRYLSPRFSASSRLRFRTLICASDRFSWIFRWGKSSKCWNTMPTRARSFGRLVLRSPTEMPSTRTSPFWNGSRAFTVLISVDLPDPDGPQTTTTSPLSTSVEQSVSTWKLPYHFDTSRISIIAMPAIPLFSVRSASGLPYHRDARLQPLDEERQRVADHEVDDRHE